MLSFVGKNRDLVKGFKVLLTLDSHVGIERYLMAVELYNNGWRGTMINEALGVMK